MTLAVQSATMADTQRTPDLVDLSRPILGQVGAMGAAYDAWVHAAISPRAARAAGAVSASDGAANEGGGGAGDVRQPPKWSSSLRIFRAGRPTPATRTARAKDGHAA